MSRVDNLMSGKRRRKNRQCCRCFTVEKEKSYGNSIHVNVRQCRCFAVGKEKKPMSERKFPDGKYVIDKNDAGLKFLADSVPNAERDPNQCSNDYFNLICFFCILSSIRSLVPTDNRRQSLGVSMATTTTFV